MRTPSLPVRPFQPLIDFDPAFAQDAGGDYPTDGEAVNLCVNQGSGGNANITSTAGSNLFRPTGFNGRPAIDIADAGDFGPGTVARGVANYTQFWVLETPSTWTDSLISYGANGNNQPFSTILPSTGELLSSETRNANDNRRWARSATGVFSSGTKYIVITRMTGQNPATWTHRVNGSSVSISTEFPGTASWATDFNRFSKRSSAGRQGYRLARWMWMSSSATDQQLDDMEAYLAALYGISI